MPEQERSRVEDQTLPSPMRQVDSSFGRKTQRLSDYAVPRGEPGPRDGREESVTGTGMGTRTRTRMSEDRDWGGGAIRPCPAVCMRVF